MQRVDGAYLYELGAHIRPLEHVTMTNRTYANVYMFLSTALTAVRNCLYSSIFQRSLKAAQAPGAALVQILDEMTMKALKSENWTTDQFNTFEVASLERAFRRLESVLMAELQTSALYYAMPKGGFDIAALTDAGETCFPDDLATKVPAALYEVRGGRQVHSL